MKILLLFSPFKIIEEGLISLLMLIDAKIYGLFSKLYSLYLELAMARIFDITSFDNVIKNVYVLFGVIALFIVAFSLLQAMINPDDAAKGTSTVKDILKRLILCVGATCLVPFAFDFLYDFQYSILSEQVIPKTMIGISSQENVDFSGEYTNNLGETEEWKASMSKSDLTKSGLQSFGNQMAFYVLNGFLYANDTNGDGISDNVKVNASKHFGLETGIASEILGCFVGVVVTAGLAFSGVGIPAAATTALGTAGICAGGVAVGFVVNETLITITAEDFYWNEITYLIHYYGKFDFITPFSEAVVDGRMSYTPIVSTIAGVILLYMLFSFCLDLGVRAAKLVFYQMIAPISFLLSILPKNKDLMTNWFKLVISTWLEVFVRIICVCGAALLISNLNFTELNNFDLIGRAIIVLGVVAFAKQAPKLFSEVTGIKSGNLKLGIKEKLAGGGAFAAGAVIGGGLTAGIRNLTNAGQNVRNKYQENRANGKSKLKSVLGASGTAFKGVGSVIGGSFSGGVRAGKSGFNAKSFGDMKNAASRGATRSVKNREARIDRNNRYKANDNILAQNFVGGHVLDFWEDFKDYATGGSSKSNAVISVGGKFDKQWSKIKSTAGDMKKKKLSDSSKFFDEHIVLKMNDGYFKGDNNKEVKSLFEQLVSSGKIKNMRELEEYYAGLNSKVIESSAYTKYDEEAYQATVRNAINSVDRKLFETRTEIRTGIYDALGKEIVREEVKIDEARYKQAIEDARKSVSKSQFSMGIDQVAYEQAQQKLNVEKSLIASMIAQIDKKSTEEVIDLSLQEATGYGLGNSDYLELKAEKDIFGEMFKMAGGVVEHLEKGIIDNVSTAGNMKDAAEAYKDLASKAAGEAKRAEIKKEARKNDDK